MKTILLSLFLMINTSIWGQYFAEPGTKWSYKIVIFNLEMFSSYVETFTASEKIEFEGKLATTLRFDKGHCNSSVNHELLDALAYEEGIVYMYNWDKQDWTILYDFNATAGDKWEVEVDENCTIEIEIESVGYEIVDGDSLKYLNVVGGNDSEFPGTRIYERMGGNFYLLPNIFHSSCGSFCDGTWISGGLRCYEDSLISYKSIDDQEDCEILLSSSIEPLESKNFKIYPNPVTSELYFDPQFIPINEIDKILIYDIRGKLVYESDVSIPARLDLNYLSKGVYSLVSILKHGELKVNKFLKL